MSYHRFMKMITLWLALGATFLSAQTTGINLSWDLGTENDLYLYRVFRSTAPNASSQLDSVQAPQHSYTDNGVQKGVLYYYRLKSVDFSLNSSDYTNELSVAIPKISGMSSSEVLPSDTTIQIPLDNYVDDPDDPDNTLVWSISGADKLTVSINNNRVASISTPSNWNSQETLLFRVKDDQGFEDTHSMSIRSSSSPTAQPPKFTGTISTTVEEDGQGTVILSDYVSDPDSKVDDLVFTITEVNSIDFSINKNKLTITPAANWYGQRTATVTVTDETGLSDQTTLTVTVNAVNDAPVLSGLPSLNLSQDTTVTVDMQPYVFDVDDNIANISWSFTNYSRISLSFDDSKDILTITTPGDWDGFEYVSVRVTDVAGDTDTDTLVVRVTPADLKAPVISNFPQVSFDEDAGQTVQLNNYVTDDDDPVQNLFWFARNSQNISVDIDHSENTALFTATEDWNGSSEVRLIVTDPDGNKDSVQVAVLVKAVNDPPVFSALPSVNLSEQLSRQLSLASYTSDVDNLKEDLSWSTANEVNVTVQITSAGLATFSVDSAYRGQEVISVYVSDTGGARDTTTITVYRQDQARAPHISAIADISFAEDTQRSIDLRSYVSDSDNDVSELSWTFNTLENIDLDLSDSDELTLIPNANWNGQEEIFLEVRDPDGNVDFDTLLVTVTPVNDAPRSRSVSSITMTENSFQTLPITDFFIDPDGVEDLVSIDLITSGEGFIGYFIDDAAHAITFFTPAGFRGHEVFLLKVSDNAGAQASTVFTITVVTQSVSGGVQVAYLGSGTNVAMNWKTVLPTIDYIEYGTSTAYDKVTEGDSDFTLEHDQQISGLQENTIYHFRVVSRNEAGQISFSADSVFSTAESGEINVFPIPYKATLDTDGRGIFFTDLPLVTDLAIYNIIGEPVFNQRINGPLYRWNVKNNNNKDISSGLYIYVIKDEQGNKRASGKLVVIR